MINKVATILVTGVCAIGGMTHPVEAKVVRIEVERTTPYAGGRTFGEAGAFERLEGTVFMEVDPHDPRNAVIVNLDRAPRNAEGRVEFSAPFVLIRPVDVTRGNGKLLYGINNRGNAIEIPFQTFPQLAPSALDAWADGGIEPPRSNYPDVSDGTLATVAEAAKTFPAIPGVTFPTVVNELWALDYGPTFGPEGGRITMLPPARGARYQVLVPTTDRDGHDLAGIRTVDIAVPVGTNTGWNLRPPGPRGQDLCGLSGSFIPFARTQADRLASGDPRASLAERYGDHQGFVDAVRRAAERSVQNRLLLEEDARVIAAMAEASDILR